ncbi:Rz-like spanin [Vibrio phage D49]
MDNDNKSLAKLAITILVVVMLLLTFGCASKDPIRVTKTEIHLTHPQVLEAPTDPGIKVKVITKERIEKGELRDTAYIGFEYDDWLEFAKWMHKYRTHNMSLQEGLDFYQAQDTRNKELPKE